MKLGATVNTDEHGIAVVESRRAYPAALSVVEPDNENEAFLRGDVAKFSVAPAENENSVRFVATALTASWVLPEMKKATGPCPR